MVELITQIDEGTYRELERRARLRQRSVSEEAAELLRLALSDTLANAGKVDRTALIKHLQTLHAQLKSGSFTSSPDLIREDRERR
jgi:hypothetical protein